MVRKLLRAAGWAGKGVLALVALGALVAWPWGYAQLGRFHHSRYALGDEQGNWSDASAGSGAAWVAFRWGHGNVRGGSLMTFRDLQKVQGPGWSWDSCWPLNERNEVGYPFAWSPVCWSWYDGRGSNFECAVRNISVPCWLLASLAGAWPLASVALLVRLRRRARRLRLVGCCRRCRYDLRATPAADGARLAVCPECGAASAAT